MSEQVDVLIVGAGISGIGAGYHLTHQCPDTSFVDSRGAGRVRRHLADPQVPGHPLRHRSLHVRLPLQAVDGTADRDRGRDPQISGRGDRRERARPPHPLPAPDRARQLVEPGASLDRRGAADRHGRAGPPHRQLPVDVPGLLPPCRGLHARLAGHGALRGPDRPSADLAGGSGLSRQAGPGHRLGRHGGHARAGDGGRCQPCHRAAALADLVPHGAQRDPDRRRAARAGGRRELDPRDRPAQDPP